MKSVLVLHKDSKYEYHPQLDEGNLCIKVENICPRPFLYPAFGGGFQLRATGRWVFQWELKASPLVHLNSHF